jgi:hypothetical protein
MAKNLSLIKEGGKGRAFVIFSESSTSAELTSHLFDALVQRSRTLLVECDDITDDNWQELTVRLSELLGENGLRQASFVGFGPSCALIQNLAINQLKLVRTIVLVDGTTRPHPTLMSRVIDRIERSLPLGLPFRSKSNGFDGRSFLQRIRCPALVVSSRSATPFLEAQAKVLAIHLPTSWHVVLSQSDQASELADLVLEFEGVPAKCPQKAGLQRMALG